MRLHEQAAELQRVVELAVAVVNPLALREAGLDVGEGGLVSQREGHEAPAVEVDERLVAPVAAIEGGGGTPAFALRVGESPVDAAPAAVALYPYADLAEPVNWRDEEEDTKAGAFALIETYLRDTPIPLQERPEGVEVSVEKDLARYGLPKLVGIIDLVRQGGRIVDFKTTGRTPDPGMVLHTSTL